MRGPSLPLVGNRLGSWSAACRAAGVTAGRAVRDNYTRQWTNAELLTIVRSYLSSDHALGSVDDYDRWRTDEAPWAPSSATLRNRLGTWRNIREQAAWTGRQ